MIPSKYSNVQPVAIASYNYVDIAKGTGIANYYIGSLSGANILTSDTFYSDPIVYSQVGAGTTAFTLAGDEDYDVVFNRPIIVEGDCIINVTSGWASVEKSLTQQVTEYLVVELFKVSGGTTTSLGSATSSQKSTSGTSATSKIRAMKINIPNTKFKIGDSLRVNVKQYGKNATQTNTIQMGWGTDPKDRDDDTTVPVIETSHTTIGIVKLPLKIEL